MKIKVITDERGNIVGTAGLTAPSKPEAGTGGPFAGPGQSVREVDVPTEFQRMDAAELHQRLADHLGK